MNTWPEVEHFNPINERLLPVLVYDPKTRHDSVVLLWMRKENVERHSLNGKYIVYCYGQIVDESLYHFAFIRAFRENPNWKVPAELKVPDESEFMLSLRGFVEKHLRFATKWLPEKKMRTIRNPEYFPGAIRVPDFRGLTNVQMPPFRCGTFAKKDPDACD